jgi:hypothetical protein
MCMRRRLGELGERRLVGGDGVLSLHERLLRAAQRRFKDAELQAQHVRLGALPSLALLALVHARAREARSSRASVCC